MIKIALNYEKMMFKLDENDWRNLADEWCFLLWYGDIDMKQECCLADESQKNYMRWLWIADEWYVQYFDVSLAGE